MTGRPAAPGSAAHQCRRARQWSDSAQPLDINVEAGLVECLGAFNSEAFQRVADPLLRFPFIIREFRLAMQGMPHMDHRVTFGVGNKAGDKDFPKLDSHLPLLGNPSGERGIQGIA
ncbi:hypothetical protein NKH99_31390 [Mesorhizobium sp. M0854]|uniref:hypothetical protein n=1 Tax=Mesorhizobium sp. M0854 TaxID=2957013 RepID=UPI00333D82AF